MKKFLLVLAAMLLCVNMPAMAQKKNSRGLKMVRHIKVRWFTPEDEPIRSKARDLYYHYDEETHLVGIDDVERDEDGVWAMKFRKQDDENIIGKLYNNDKLDPRYTIQLYLYRGEPFRRADDRFLDDYLKTRELYTVTRRGNVDVVLYEKLYKPEGVTNKDSLMSYLVDAVDRLDDKNYITYGGRNLDSRPFKGELCCYFDKNGGLYRSGSDGFDPSTDMQVFFYLNGDLHQVIRYRDNGDIKQMNEYSDRKNDTNMEFYGLATSYYRLNWCAMPEFTSEWCARRSKHLINYEDKTYPYGKNYQEQLKKSNPERYEQKMAEAETKCTSEWHYTFDAKDNLTRIDVICYDWFHNRCVMEIEYVQ